jgi:hypothetical protein
MVGQRLEENVMVDISLFGLKSYLWFMPEEDEHWPFFIVGNFVFHH